MEQQEPILEPMSVVVAETGIPRQTLARWATAGKIRGRKDPISGHWDIDVQSVPARLRRSYLRHSATARAADRERAMQDDFQELRAEIHELRGIVREKDALIAELTRKIIAQTAQ